MKLFKSIAGKFSAVNKYRSKLILVIAAIWTLVDTLYTVVRFNFLDIQTRYYFFEYQELNPILLREVIIFFMSGMIGYVLVLKFKRNTRNLPLWFNFLTKTLVLIFL